MRQPGRDLLLIGGDGLVGRAVATRLRATGLAPRRLSRQPGPTEVVVGDLTDRASLAPALAGIRRCLVVLPCHPAERELGENLARALSESPVERLVCVSLPRQPQLAHLPRVAAWTAVLAALEDTGIPVIELQANHLMQEDLAWREDLCAGRFLLPLGAVGVHRLDVRDLADAAARCLIEDGLYVGRFRLDGAEALSAAVCAAVWSQALGRPVRAEDDPTAYRRACAADPAWQVEDRLGFCAAVRAGELPTSTGIQIQTRALIGHAQRPYQAFVQDCVRAWSLCPA